MLGWNMGPMSQTQWPSRCPDVSSGEAEHEVGVWVVEIDPSEVDRIREQVRDVGERCWLVGVDGLGGYE